MLTRLRPAPGYCPIEDAIQMKKLDTDPAISCQISHASCLHQTGLDWIDDNNMKSVLLRHYPTLGPPIQYVANVFAPWNRSVARP